MKPPPDFTPDLNSLKLILLAFSREQSLEAAIQLLVRQLVDTRPFVVRSGIWLATQALDALEPREPAPREETQALHLVASAATAGAQDMAALRHESGTCRTVPLGEPPIGHVASSPDPIVRALDSPWPWEQRPAWAAQERISGYSAVALRHRGELLGVLANFLEEGFTIDEDLIRQAEAWMQLFADHVGAAISNARAFGEVERLRHQLELENEYLREEVLDFHEPGDFIGKSSALGKVLQQIEVIAPTDSIALIYGESGTGKELVARAIHQKSQRQERPLIKVNCASVPRELFESEFFGHVKGAFTGALRDRTGRFELADGGTLFLDEVGEIPLELQAKLLRVLQEGEFEPVGAETTRHVNSRVIAATNRDLRREVKEKRFRQDLYYRLSVFPIEVPPLRERPEDIAPLAAHFLEQSCRRLGRPRIRLKRRHVLELESYPWPGNIRELENIIERAILLSRSGVLRFELPRDEEGEVGSPMPPPIPREPQQILTETRLRDLERQNLRAALEETNWKVSGAGGAAELLGIKPTTLISRMKKMGIRKPR